MSFIVKLVFLIVNVSFAEDYKAILHTFIPEVEGYEAQSYNDGKNNLTIGYGFNLDSVNADEIIKSLGLDPVTLKSGKQTITLKTAHKLLDKKILEKNRLFQIYQKRHFASIKFTENQKAALISMMYNSPKLIGPEMKKLLNTKNHVAIMKEIILRSNGDKSPGILKRRLKEAELYGGTKLFNKVIHSLTPDELALLQYIAGRMKNANELRVVTTKYPFLAAR